MNCCPTLRRWLAALLTAAILVPLLALLLWSGRSADPSPAAAEGAKPGVGWPLFGGTVQRNMVNTFEKNMPTEWDVATGKNIKWVAELGSKAYGGPTVAGGKVFVGTNNDRPRNPRDVDPETKQPIDKGIVMCFDEATGRFLWQSVHDKLAAGRVQDWPKEGICSSPYLEGNRLYYVSNRCEVICADVNGLADGNQGVQDEKYKSPTDADIIWKLDMIGELGVFPHNLATCSPLIVGDTLFVITSNGVDEGHINIPKPQAPSFLAIDKNTGKVKWKNNLPSAALLAPGANLKHLVDRGLVLMHGQWSNPVYTTVEGKGQIIFPGGDGWVRSFEPDTGTLIWQFDANPKSAVYRLGGAGTRNDFVSTPVIHENKLYIGVGQDPEHDAGVGHFWCVDVEKATKLKGDVSSESVAGDDGKAQKAMRNPKSCLVWHFGGLIDPAPDDGREYYFGRTMSTAAVADGLIYLGEQEGFLHCLDARTGKKYWDHDLKGSTWSSPYVVDGKVYMGNDKNKLQIFAHGKEKKKIAEIDMKGMVRATPVAANGVLYVMTENKLYAIKK